MDAVKCATSRILQHRPHLPDLPGAGSVITDPCPKCKGEGRQLRERTVETKVPAGVEDGTRIRFPDSAKPELSVDRPVIFTSSFT